MSPTPKSRYSPAARLTLAAALLLLLGSLAQLGYRYTLPTDGWDVLTDEAVGNVWIYYANRVGAPSGLQRGDTILAVDGLSVVEQGSESFVPPPPGWRAGQTVTIRVRRGAAEMDVAVPVVRWTPAAVLRSTILDPIEGPELLGALLLLGVGWFTFWRRPDEPSARALLLLSTAVGATFLSSALPLGLSMQFDRTAYRLALFYSYAIFGTVLAPALLTFTLLFPRPKRVIRRRPWLAGLPFAWGGLLLLALVRGAPGEAGWYSTLAFLALSIASLIHAWLTQRDPVSRAQLRWAISGFVAGLALFMLNFPLGFNWVTQPAVVTLFVVLQSFGFAVIGIGLAVAVLRYRLYDIDVILRKTLVYALLTALLALVYFGSVVLLQTAVGRAAGEQSPLVIVLSTLLIAALFAPLRRRVQAFIDRRFFRQKVDAQRVLAQFAVTARDEVALETLQAELLRVVTETMQPEMAGIWLERKRDRSGVQRGVNGR